MDILFQSEQVLHVQNQLLHCNMLESLMDINKCNNTSTLIIFNTTIFSDYICKRRWFSLSTGYPSEH